MGFLSGLFGSSYETYVGTSISQFGDTRQFVSSKTKGVIEGISRNESLPEHIMENLVKGAGFRAKKAYSYGGNGYIFGRPNDALLAKAGTVTAIKAAISNYLTSLGATTVHYTGYGLNNYYHAIYKQLKSIYNFNFVTSELPTLTASKGFTVTLHTATALINSSYVGLDLDNFTELSYYPVQLKESTGVSSIGSEITYRWHQITSTPSTNDWATPEVLDSSTTTTPYPGGAVDYTTTTYSYGTPVASGPFITTYTEGASPPDIYDVINVTETLNRTSTSTTKTVNTYTAATQTLVVNVYVYDTVHDSIVTVRDIPSQETALVSSDISFSLSEQEKTYCYGAYTDAYGVVQFFDYDTSLGSIPALDGSVDTSYSTPGSYMPRLYFRWANQPADSNTLSTEYIHGKKMSKKIGINYGDVIDAIHSLDGRTQEQLDQVTSAFLMWGVQADANDPIQLRYLYDHFADWFGVIGGITTMVPLATFNSSLTKDDMFEHVLVIEDTRFKITLGMQGIWKRTVTGAIGAVGTYGNQIGQVNVSQESASSEFTYTQYTSYPYHCYRYQHSTTEYTEYEVIGLETKYYVSGGNASTSGWTADVADPKDILYVPLNYAIVQNWKPFEQEEIMYKTTQIVVNSMVVVEVKWYQSGFWSFVFQVAAIAAMVYGFSEGYGLLSGLATIAGVSVVWAFELALSYLIEYLTVVIAVNLFVNAVGEEAAFLTALVVAAYALYSGGSWSGLTPKAKELMNASNALFKGATDSIQRQLQDYQTEYNLFIEEAKQKTDELKSIWEELNGDSNPVSYVLAKESVSDFYNRTLQTNIGTKVFDLQHDYVDLSLQLPK